MTAMETFHGLQNLLGGVDGIFVNLKPPEKQQRFKLAEFVLETYENSLHHILVPFSSFFC